jgi:hypothetical protein
LLPKPVELPVELLELSNEPEGRAEPEKDADSVGSEVGAEKVVEGETASAESEAEPNKAATSVTETESETAT